MPAQSRFQPLDHPAALELPRHVEAVAWQEHIPFAMALVEMLRPRVLVELGVHSGDSYLALCQAAERAGGECRCYGVDTWRGDEHAGFYGEEVLRALREQHDPRYGGFSRLVQATFDEAARNFPEGQTDLLHIDGFHTYEAVRHDWETWQPKLSSRGVALFHDVNVRENGFGVWKLWEELQEKFPSFTFSHGHGLGVLAAGKKVPEALRPLVDASAGDRARIGELYFALGSRITLEAQVRKLRALTDRVREYDALALAQKARIESLERHLDAARDVEMLRQQLDEACSRAEAAEAAAAEMASSRTVRAVRAVKRVAGLVMRRLR